MSINVSRETSKKLLSDELKVVVSLVVFGDDKVWRGNRELSNDATRAFELGKVKVASESWLPNPLHFCLYHQKSTLKFGRAGLSAKVEEAARSTYS